MSGERPPLPLWLPLAGLFVSYWARVPAFLSMLAIYRTRPLDLALFPAGLERLDVALVAFLAPGLVGVVGFHPRLRALAFATFALGSGVLLLHQFAYNDATFVTALWTSLVALYLTLRERRGALRAQHVAALTQLFVGVLFLGGFVGKLTPGYLDGSVFYDIYFVDRDYLPFRLARAWLSPDALRRAATLYSRAVLAVELCLATLPLWPPRLGLTAAMLSLSGLVALNNPYLISVAAGPLALCAMSLVALQRTHRDPP